MSYIYIYMYIIPPTACGATLNPKCSIVRGLGSCVQRHHRGGGQHRRMQAAGLSCRPRSLLRISGGNSRSPTWCTFSTYIYIYTRIFKNMYVYIYIYTCTYIHVCIYIYIYVYGYLCVIARYRGPGNDEGS